MTYTSTNFEKYRTNNLVVRKLIHSFFDKIRSVVITNLPADAKKVLDAGCGEGETYARISDLIPNVDYTGIDYSQAAVEYSAQRHQNTPAKFMHGSIYELPFEKGAFDAAFCFEVLEHLDTPERGLLELDRVTRGPLIVSVPYEPYFQLGNLARGKYLRGLGNHPEHVNHWNLKSFKKFLRLARNNIVVESSFPWIIGVAKRSLL